MWLLTKPMTVTKMADRPTDGITALAELSDDDLDSIVDSELSALAGGDSQDIDTASTVDTDPESSAPAVDTAHEATSDPEAARPAAGNEEARVPAGTNAPAAPAVAAPSAAPPAAISIDGASPFQFKASGNVHAFPGALELKDGSVLISKDSQGQLRMILSSERELKTNYKTLQKEMRQKDAARSQERTDKDIQADAMIAMFDGLTNKTDEELWEWCQNFKASVPDLQMKIREEKLARDRKELELRANPPMDPEEAAERQAEAVVGELTTTYKAAIEIPDIKQYLSTVEVNAVFQRHAKNLKSLVRVGDDGKQVFDPRPVIDDLLFQVDLKKRTPTGPSADARNAARNADIATTKPNVIPPVVAPSVTPSPRPKGKGKESYKGDRAGFKKDFMAGLTDFGAEDD